MFPAAGYVMTTKYLHLVERLHLDRHSFYPIRHEGVAGAEAVQLGGGSRQNSGTWKERLRCVGAPICTSCPIRSVYLYGWLVLGV